MGGTERARKPSAGAACRCGGFTLVALLLFIVVSMFALSGVVTVWTTAARRDREAELLFIGAQYRAAIESYYKSSPGAGQLPERLEDLLKDTRTGVLRRHLRRLYRDPMTGEANWALVLTGGRIAGVYSSSTDIPIKVAGLDLPGAEAAASYQDWKFVFAGAIASGGAGGGGGAGQTAEGAVGGAGGMLVAEAPSALTLQACERQRQLDAQECAGTRGYAGVTKDDLEACTASMEARHQLCMVGKGGQAGPLLVPQIQRDQ